ncbi:hypothetical protein F5887DRAFT_678993 [Amanita rubescens]|nr:hypothetical protein F5887DRAFT_678993 [Amanita rubescens]
MRPLYRWLLTFFFTQIHPSTFYARNTHPVPFLLSPGPIFAIESSPTRPSVIFLYKVISMNSSLQPLQLWTQTFNTELVVIQKNIDTSHMHIVDIRVN